MKNLLGLVIFAFVLATLPATAGGFTAEIYGGGNWGNVSIDNGPFKASDDKGYVMGATVAKQIDSIPGLSIGADLSYRSQDIKASICKTPLIITDETWALTGVADYELPVQAWGIKPYVMAGAGYGSREAKIDYTDIGVSNTGLVWQVGAGVRTTVAEGVQLGIGYRYFDAPDLDVAPSGDFHTAGENHSVIATLKIDL